MYENSIILFNVAETQKVQNSCGQGELATQDRERKGSTAPLCFPAPRHCSLPPKPCSISEPNGSKGGWADQTCSPLWDASPLFATFLPLQQCCPQGICPLPQNGRTATDANSNFNLSFKISFGICSLDLQIYSQVYLREPDWNQTHNYFYYSNKMSHCIKFQGMFIYFVTFDIVTISA